MTFNDKLSVGFVFHFRERVPGERDVEQPGGGPHDRGEVDLTLTWNNDLIDQLENCQNTIVSAED